MLCGASFLSSTGSDAQKTSQIWQQRAVAKFFHFCWDLPFKSVRGVCVKTAHPHVSSFFKQPQDYFSDKGKEKQKWTPLIEWSPVIKHPSEFNLKSQNYQVFDGSFPRTVNVCQLADCSKCACVRCVKPQQEQTMLPSWRGKQSTSDRSHHLVYSHDPFNLLALGCAWKLLTEKQSLRDRAQMSEVLISRREQIPQFCNVTKV